MIYDKNIIDLLTNYMMSKIEVIILIILIIFALSFILTISYLIFTQKNDSMKSNFTAKNLIITSFFAIVLSSIIVIPTTITTIPKVVVNKKIDGIQVCDTVVLNKTVVSENKKKPVYYVTYPCNGKQLTNSVKNEELYKELTLKSQIVVVYDEYGNYIDILHGSYYGKLFPEMH